MNYRLFYQVTEKNFPCVLFKEITILFSLRNTGDYMLYYININSSPGTVSCGGGHILVQIHTNEMTRMESLN